MPTDDDVPPEGNMGAPDDDVPMGFWAELVSAIHEELKPPISGFFIDTPKAPVRGVLRQDKVVLRCTNSFTMQMIDKPEIIALVSRKASNLLGKRVTAVVEDETAAPADNSKMQRLMDFGRAHSDIVKIKEN